MRIEPATGVDVDDLVELWVALAETQREHGSHIGAASNREAVRPLLAHHVVEGSVLVARSDGGDVVGFSNFGLEGGMLEADAERGIVHNLYVEPSARGEGTGSALLDAAEAALVERGADVIAIEALWDNEDARRMYRERGYEPHRVQFEREVDGEEGGADADEDTEKSDTNTRDGG